MSTRTLYLISLLLPSLGMMAQRQLIVVNAESKVPIRDVIVNASDGREIRTPWNGVFEWPDSVRRLDFRHPDFERRYVLRPEIQGDTIFLIPNIHALREVVILGERRFDKRMSSMLRTTPEQKLNDQLARISIPSGFSPLAFALLVYDVAFRKSVEEHARRKKALKEVRRQETMYQERWEELEKPSK